MNLTLALLAADIDPDYSPELAKAEWELFRLANGWSPKAPLLSWPSDRPGKKTNIKLAKNLLPTLSSSMAPANISGHNSCDDSTIDCRDACVAKNGNGRYAKTMLARALRNQFALVNPSAYIALMSAELSKAEAKYGRIACRLNVFSDLPWEKIAPWLFTRHPNVRFYDYTKTWARRTLPSNYHLTYSVSERTDLYAATARVREGSNIAVVFSTKRGQPLPTFWHGCRVIDGDATDQRFDDPTYGVVVGLRAKGRMVGKAMVRG